MYKDVLRSIEGIEVFPVIGIIIFFTFFTAWLIYAFSMKKEQVNALSSLPLELDSDAHKNELTNESNV
ncbi:hypothetical protein V6R21_30935 [Limibacter armeniacum]|uniref:hypothetical protein n=1 Tax=Limibacter armeniacum TaxID=466084 RepID=UPI002FE645FA